MSNTQNTIIEEMKFEDYQNSVKVIMECNEKFPEYKSMWNQMLINAHDFEKEHNLPRTII